MRVVRHCLSLTRCASSSSVVCGKVMTNPEDISKLYRELSLFPSLTRADVGPVITSQYGGKYSNIYTGVCVCPSVCLCLPVRRSVWVFIPFIPCPQNGVSGIWRGTRMSSSVGSTLCFTTTSLWSTLDPQGTAQRSRESMWTFDSLTHECVLCVCS